MGLAATSLLGQGDIPPTMWADPPRGLSHYLEVQAGLEATHSTEDSYIRMASLTAAAHDPGRAPAHASSQPCELPSLRWGSGGLLPPLLSMPTGSGGMEGGRGGLSFRDI